ncbi:TPA: PcfD, partial [Streptococcus suis 92-4172]|nr:PcfD [Streptococcus suis 92-4172]
LAHADLHSSKTTDKELKYSHAELQAESVAYIVSNHYGLDTGSYTFGYLASWTEDKTALTDLEAQLEIVQKEAQQLIYSLDRELEKQLEQTKE